MIDIVSAYWICYEFSTADSLQVLKFIWLKNIFIWHTNETNQAKFQTIFFLALKIWTYLCNI